MLYEIISPSDPYTFVAPSRETACLAILLLGNGKYGVKELENGSNWESPLFLIATDNMVDQWLQEEFGFPISELGERIRSKNLELADALDSVRIGTPAQRESIEQELLSTKFVSTDPTAPESPELALHAIHDRYRSSVNDIGRRAWALAKNLRQLPARETPAASQD